MTEVLTAAEMRAIEQAAIAAGAATGLDLMERAGRGVLEAILDWRPELARGTHRAAVLCGPGNNGGDGFVVARLLREHGWTVGVHLWGRPPAEIDRLPADAAASALRLRAAGGAIGGWSPDAVRRIRADLIVDALFGAGLARALPEAVIAPLAGLRASGAAAGRTVAVDGPSGLCLDSGRCLTPGGDAVVADLTVTFHRPRVGHMLGDGPDCCGRLAVADIGLGDATIPGAARLAVLADRPQRLGKATGRHKYDHGHALVLAGGVGRGGAGRLAARGALRVGAGLVTLACPPAALIENAARLDAIMLRPVADAAALAALLGDPRIAAVCLGPGLGTGERTRALVAAACAGAGAAPRPEAGPPGPAAVLDADALTAFAPDPAALFAMLPARAVLTPHRGEFGRLFPDILARLEAPPAGGPAVSKLDATRAAAARAGCTVLFKGRDTVIAEPSGRAVVAAAAYGREAPWLATAGSGDVLAGMIAGLLARGFEPLDAAAAAAWLHVEAARRFGPGLIAEDIPEMLPGVFRDLGL